MVIFGVDIRVYFLLFITYAFLGWCIEVIGKLIQYKRFINRGFLVGPYCPIYGVGALLITFLLKKYLSGVKDIKTLRNKLLRFTTPASVCSYCTGEMRIGESHQMGMLKKMEFDYDE